MDLGNWEDWHEEYGETGDCDDEEDTEFDPTLGAVYFDGECYECGAWGHRAFDCAKRKARKGGGKQGKGKGKSAVKGGKAAGKGSGKIGNSGKAWGKGQTGQAGKGPRLARANARMDVDHLDGETALQLCSLSLAPKISTPRLFMRIVSKLSLPCPPHRVLQRQFPLRR